LLEEAQDKESWYRAKDGVEDEVVGEDGYTEGMLLFGWTC